MVGRVHPVLNAEVDATTPLHATCIEETDPASRHHQVELAVEDVTAYVRSLYDHSLAREARRARIECVEEAAALIDKLEAQAAARARSLSSALRRSPANCAPR